MGNAHNHTGKKFGKLTAVERVGSSKSGSAVWLCHCDCGGTREVAANLLVELRARSCGCINQMEDLAGKRFGRLEVLEYVSTNGNGNACWRCRCDCGTEKIINASLLKNAKSCGCKLAEHRRAYGKRMFSTRHRGYLPPASIEELEDLVR